MPRRCTTWACTTRFGPRPAPAAVVANSIPNFSATVNDHGTSFTYNMAGKNPRFTVDAEYDGQDHRGPD